MFTTISVDLFVPFWPFNFSVWHNVVKIEEADTPCLNNACLCQGIDVKVAEHERDDDSASTVLDNLGKVELISSWAYRTLQQITCVLSQFDMFSLYLHTS